jgi:hypothetical protein
MTSISDKLSKIIESMRRDHFSDTEIRSKIMQLTDKLLSNTQTVSLTIEDKLRNAFDNYCNEMEFDSVTKDFMIQWFYFEKYADGGWRLKFEDVDLKIDSIICSKLNYDYARIEWNVLVFGFDFSEWERNDIRDRYSGSINGRYADYRGKSTSTHIYLADLYEYEICHFDVSIQFRYDQETGFGDNSNYFDV